MQSISLLLQRVNDNVNGFNMKLNFSEPKIYTGGVNIEEWSSLSKEEKQIALNKDWFVYYSFRELKSGRLKRQPHIKAGANRIKNKAERLQFLKTLQKNLTLLLKAGFDPNQDNSKIEQLFFDLKTSSTSESEVLNNKLVNSEKTNKTEARPVTIEEAIKLGLDTKHSVLNPNSYSKFKSRINRFKKWLSEEQNLKASIDTIEKRDIINYLNLVLKNSSPRNRNNTRTDLSSLFQVFEDNDIIIENFIKKINVLRAIPERNKTYTPKLQKELYNYLKENDEILLLFVKFISFNLLRPIEVCRLQIKDIDISDKKLYVRAKNKHVKIKIIPEIMLKDIPDLSKLNKELFLFTPEGIGGNWSTSEDNKRNYFTKRFKKIKDHFKLGKDYGLYSFRHTFITMLYRELVKKHPQFEAKSKLMLITGHATMTALDQYLRDVDAQLPEDYSKMFS